eukprot:352816-Chlamydomonas_euryale.AAC.2
MSHAVPPAADSPAAYRCPPLRLPCRPDSMHVQTPTAQPASLHTAALLACPHCCTASTAALLACPHCCTASVPILPPTAHQPSFTPPPCDRAHSAANRPASKPSQGRPARRTPQTPPCRTAGRMALPMCWRTRGRRPAAQWRARCLAASP